MANINWNYNIMIEGKCTGNGCPIKKRCLRYTTLIWKKETGYIRPPHNEDGHFPERCKDFMSNDHKPIIKTVEIQD